MNVRRQVGPAVAIIVCLVALVVLGLSQNSLRADGAGESESTAQAKNVNDVSLEGLTYERVKNPAGTVVRDDSGKLIAHLTDTARTAVLTGPKRTLEEPRNTDARVVTNKYVRVLPKPFKKGAQEEDWFQEWFAEAVNDRSPDALEIGTQYFQGAESKYDENGLRYAGDADFGPLKDDGSGLRDVGGDFNDYLEITVSHPDKEHDPPEQRDANSLDCSGFLRIVYGYRLGYPMFGKNETKGDGLQRTVNGMYKYAPGVTLVKDKGSPPPISVTKKFLPGDVLFFDTHPAEDGLEHSAIYLGVDNQGKHRFMSSRDAVNGPTMGDVMGPSIIDGHGLFANNWRAAHRL